MNTSISGSRGARVLAVGPATALVFLLMAAGAARADGFLSATVKDASTGAPLENVIVVVRTCDGARVASGSTNATGTFTSSALPAGSYAVRTSNESGYIDQVYKGIECAGTCDVARGTFVPVANGATSSVTIALRPGARIAGLVTGPSGPAPEVSINVYNERREYTGSFAHTGTDGSYVTGAGLPPGAYYLKTWNESHLIDGLYGGVQCPCGGRCNVLRGTPVVVTGPGTVSGVDLTLAGGGVIAGHVVDGVTGAPIGGSVGFADADGSCGSTSIAADGSYVSGTGLPTGDYVVTATPSDNHITQRYDGVGCPGVPPTLPTLVSVGTPSAVTGIDFRLQPGGVIAGTVWDASGAPVVGGAVNVYTAPGGGYAGTDITDAAGIYRVAGLCPGSYQATAAGPSGSGLIRQLYSGIPCLACTPGTGTGTSVAVAPAPAVTTAVDFHLQPGARIAGNLFDGATGVPRKGVGVTVYDATGRQVGTAKSDCVQGGYLAPRDTGLTSGDYFVTSGSSPYMPYPYGYRVQEFRLRDCVFCDLRDGEPVTVREPAVTSGVAFRLVRARRSGDYDRDGRSDVAVYQSGVWQMRAASGATTSLTFGGSSWQPVPGDFDGDGKTDAAIYNAASGWQVRLSSTGATRALPPLGVASDTVVRGDFDGDGSADNGLYRQSTGDWTIRSSARGRPTTTRLGGPRKVPVPGDYDGDRQDDLAVFDLDTRVWTILHSGSLRVETFTFGTAGQAPLTFDFDGDGRVDPATYQASTGMWNVLQSMTGTLKNFVLGDASSVPVPLDFDGDGLTDAAVYQPASHHWLIRLSGSEAVLDIAFAGGTPLN